MRRVLAVLTVVTALVAPVAVSSAQAAPRASVTAAHAPALPVLQFRDSGAAVLIVQRALDVPKAKAKGFFNRKTQRAVKAFQQRNGLRVTGVVDAATWAALGPRVSREVQRAVAPTGSASGGGLPWESYAARDMVGYRTSVYQGKYYDSRMEQFRLCVVQREAGGQYGLNSYYQGAYQFSPSWNSTIRAYLGPEMAAKYGQAGGAAVDALANKSISNWNRFWQDAGFYAVLARNGASPWAGGNWGCDSSPGAESGWPRSSAWNYLPFEG